MLITLNTDKKLVEEIDALLREELEEASRKWSLTLSDENRALVTHRSFEQLVNKVQFISGNPWQLGRPIKFTVGDDSREFALPASDLPDIQFNRTIDKWVIAQDVNEESVPLSEFYSFALKELKAWARTAMFYGVGSFRE